MKELTFNKGDIIFKQGDFAACMYDIVSGSVGVYVGHGTETETQLTVLTKGDFLGEMGLIEVYPRSATAVALEDGTVLQEIDAEAFGEFFKTQPDRLLAIMRQLSNRLRDRTADYEGACQVLDGLKATQKEPAQRSISLLDRARQFIEFYNSMAPFAAQDADMSLGYYFPYNHHHF